MKSTLIWFILIGAVLLLGDSVAAWNRQFFNRYSRNLFRNAAAAAAGSGRNAADMNGAMPIGSAAANNEIDELNALFGINNEAAAGGSAVNRIATNVNVNDIRDEGIGGVEQQQTEVYGIVEPLIEDMPCVDRPCNVNDDCCPTGVCVNTYGEGKCVYVYGRKRDFCHRHTDCEPGMSCVKGAAGNMVCQALPLRGISNLNSPGRVIASNGEGVIGSAAVIAAKPLELRQFGEDCVTSSDCNVAKSMCCQLQRSHHRMLPKKMCAYFRDPFMCIDIMPTEDQEIRESRYLSAFSQRRM